jgi:cytochrome P450
MMADGELNLRSGLEDSQRDGFISRLHEESPLYRDAKGFWMAGRFEDVREILLDHERFSSAAMAGGGRMAGARGARMGAAASHPFSGGVPLLTDDPPRHSVLRGLLAKAFTPAAMEAMRPNIENLARDLAGAIPKNREVDIVGAMTTPLPVAVIAGMMGVPSERNMDFKGSVKPNPFWRRLSRLVRRMVGYRKRPVVASRLVSSRGSDCCCPKSGTQRGRSPLRQFWADNTVGDDDVCFGSIADIGFRSESRQSRARARPSDNIR